MRDDELKHYGVKGMKWGVRKDRLDDAIRNYRAKKLTRLANQWESFDAGYKAVDKAMRKNKYKYANWYSKTTADRLQIRSMKKRVDRLMKKYGKKYVMKYDVITKQYSFDKKPKDQTKKHISLKESRNAKNNQFWDKEETRIKNVLKNHPGSSYRIDRKKGTVYLTEVDKETGKPTTQEFVYASRKIKD